jgi:ketosteroid isomerase-like protein
MKRASLIVVLIAIALGVWGWKSPVNTAPLDESITVAAIIDQLEHGWAMAIVNKDAAALDRLLAKDFNGTSADGEPYSREMAIEDIKNGAFAVDSMEFDDVTVRVYGNTAIAFISEDLVGRYYGEDRSGHFHFTDVWVKRDGRWQVVASHGSQAK